MLSNVRNKEGNKMAKQKQHVFSARTTEDGLRLLNGIREERKIGWDELVLDAVCARYGLDTLVMSLPKAYRPEKKKAEAKGKGKGKGVKTRKEKKPVDKATEETQAQQE
jgi:hypothetical protein